MKPVLPILSAFVLLHSSLCSAADWQQFRGPNASAVSSETNAPGPKVDIAWKTDLPGRGLSSPIIVGDKVFVTCSSGPDQASLHVFCFSAADGKKLWERVMKATGRTMAHNKPVSPRPRPAVMASVSLPSTPRTISLPSTSRAICSGSVV
jgi:hypothetical protein